MYAERFGVSDAAMEGILAIGKIDTQSDYPNTVVASALWHMEPSIDRAIGKVKAGNFEPEDWDLMVHGMASLLLRDFRIENSFLHQTKSG